MLANYEPEFVFAFLIFTEPHSIINSVAKGNYSVTFQGQTLPEVTYLRKSVSLWILDSCVLAKLFLLVAAGELAN